MVDPGAMDAMAVAAATLLGTKALEAIGAEAGKGAWSSLRRLRTLVERRTEESVEGQAALQMVKAKPDDQNRILVLAQVLEEMAKEPTFAHTIEELVDEGKRVGLIGTQGANTGFVAGRDAKQTTIGGGTNIGRDQINRS